MVDIPSNQTKPNQNSFKDWFEKIVKMEEVKGDKTDKSMSVNYFY